MCQGGISPQDRRGNRPVITRDYWKLSHPDAPMAASYGTLAQCREWRDRDPMNRGADTYSIERVPNCGCCWQDASWSSGKHYRCSKHVGRNPCAIEGCTRTRAAPDNGQLANDQWLCGVHWRAYVPPRSKRRRAYHAFFRLAKREARLGGDGWPPELRVKFWRFWATLVANARRRATAGYLDEAAINREFGWE